MRAFFDRHRGILIGTFTVLALAGMIWLDATRNPQGGPSSGVTAPEIDSEILDGKPGEFVTIDSLKGSPVVLDFWATWCGPCRRTLPSIDALASEYAGRVKFYAVNSENEDPGAQRRLRDELGLKLPILPNGAAAASRYKVRALPTTVVLGRDGHVVVAFTGVTAESEIRRILDGLQ